MNIVPQNTYNRALNIALLFTFAAVATLILQGWVGPVTIYSEGLEEKRLLLHTMILENALPKSQTWEDFGANGTNIRLFTVSLADGISYLTGISLRKTYILIDTLSLFTIIILLYVYLLKWFSRSFSAIGVLYFCLILPLTYFLHYFHPWDRISLVVWIAMLYFLKEEKLFAFCLTLSLSVIIKYDSLFVPMLYFLCFVTPDNWRKITRITIGLFILTFGIHYLLRFLIPGGYAERSIELVIRQLITNWDAIVYYHVRHPVFLGFTIPVGLFIIYHRYLDRFGFASALFGCSLFIPFYLFSEFVEIRAQMPVMVLILPAALFGLRTLLEGRGLPGHEPEAK